MSESYNEMVERMRLEVQGRVGVGVRVVDVYPDDSVLGTPPLVKIEYTEVGVGDVVETAFEDYILGLKRHLIFLKGVTVPPEEDVQPDHVIVVEDDGSAE